MKINDLNDLEIYVFLLEDLYEEVLTDYKDIVKGLKEEFEIDISVEEVEKLYQPTIEEEIKDLELIHGHVNRS